MLINLKQVVIVKNAKGETNIQRLKGVASSGSGGKSTAPSGSSPAAKESKTRYRVDLLRVHIGTVTVKDYSRGKPSERDYKLNADATYKDITDSTDITRLVLMTMLSQAHLPDIGIKPDELKKNLGEGVKGLEGALNQAGKSFGDTLNQFLSSTNKSK